MHGYIYVEFDFSQLSSIYYLQNDNPMIFQRQTSEYGQSNEPHRQRFRA